MVDPRYNDFGTSALRAGEFTCVSRSPTLLTRLLRGRGTRRTRVGTHLKSQLPLDGLPASRGAFNAEAREDLPRKFSSIENFVLEIIRVGRGTNS